jgi:hypothetical protein
MSSLSLVERFLREVDKECSHLPAPERQQRHDQVAARLGALTATEQKLGASEDEAQRRAVRAVGQEYAFFPQVPVRLSPVWQVVLVYIAVEALLTSFLRLFIPREALWISPELVAVSILSATAATLCAALWHPRAALRGVLYWLGFKISFLIFWMVLFYFVTFVLQHRAVPSNILSQTLRSNFSLLILQPVATLSTLFLFLKLRAKKLPKSL